MSASLANVVDTFRQWLHLPDPAPLLASLGAVAANRLAGDPVWLLLVGSPGSGKSEILGPLKHLADVHPVATLTEAALLSGSPKRDHDAQSSGGLLREIGSSGIILCKDFGSVLSMNRDARASVLAALREIYDGSWTRHVGTDGGKTLAWSGRMGLIAGCTPTIDRHHAVMGSMGERFVILRLGKTDEDDQARRALAHAGDEGAMRDELAAATAALFEAGLSTPRALTDGEREGLIALTPLIVRCRSAIERDGYTREIELIPPAEAPARLIVVLSRLLAGLDAIGVERATAWQLVARIALDCVPALKQKLLAVLYEAGDNVELSTTELAEAVDYLANTAPRRALEELGAHGIVERFTYGEGRPHTWRLTDWARARYLVATTVPETSGGPLEYPHRVIDDISGRAA
ncbi:MAG: winged helix-turn-helix domain-containing protein [Gaiellaceae bacterium]